MKQRKVFNVFHIWANDCAKCNGYDVEPVQIFLSGSRETGKAALVKLLYIAITKGFVYHCKDSGKSRVLLLEPTGISPVNIGGTTIGSDLGIKPKTNLLGLNDKSKAALRNRLSEVKLLMIDKLSMVSNQLWI